MRIAETVTFGGGGIGQGALDRGGELRNDPDRINALRHAPDARVLTLWRGKPLLHADAPLSLVGMTPDHPVLDAGGDSVLPEVFLGRIDGQPWFVRDISNWEPEAVDAAELDAFADHSEQAHPDLPGDQRFVELRRAMAALSPTEAELCATARAILNWHSTHRFCAACGELSDAVSAGWMRRCPVCNAQHFPRTDPVVIMLITLGNSVLLGRSPHWPEGMYSLLAGFVEPGETMEAAVRREVFEETGVKVGQVDYLASQPWPFPNSLMLGCHGVALTRELTLDPVEIEDAMWLTREEAMEVISGGHSVVRAPRNGAIAGFLLRNWLADRLD
ncbi:MAG: NAD(+) diphosphatase [Celeribacter sp.]|jgi:NAD+ diphosphatase